MRVTAETIEACRTAAGGWTREQLAAWGVPWPPPKGWKRKLLGERVMGEGLKRARAAALATQRPASDDLVPYRVGDPLSDADTERAKWAIDHRAIIDGLREGTHVVVPKEPTLEMQRAYFDTIDRNMNRIMRDSRFGRHDSMKEAYIAMLAVTPTPREPA